MIGPGTVYAFAALALSSALYLALRRWYPGLAAGCAVLLFGLLSAALLNAALVTSLDAGAALAGGALGWWVYKPAAAPPLPSPPEYPLGPSDPAALDLALRQIERRADLTFHEADALDNKAGFVLGAASFLLLGVTGLQGVAATHMMETSIVHLVQWLAVGAVLIYLAVVSAALTAYMVHESAFAPDPHAFLALTRSAPPDEAAAALARDLLQAFSANQRSIAKKTAWTRRALRAFLAETLFLALILIAIAVTL